MSRQTIAVLGPKGTFTSIAAQKMYPKAELLCLETVGKVFEHVQQNTGAIGVVALENSLEGSVGETLTRLLEHEVYIIKEYVMEVKFGLVAKKGAVIDEVKELLSHPHALAQCANYLQVKLPNARLVGVNSTTDALNQAKDDETKAAVAFTETAKDYGLTILDTDIQDSYSETRFIAISSRPAEGGKTSIIFALKDQPGALQDLLNVFTENKINLTKIESRPARTQLGDYLFFIDFENKNMHGRELARLLHKIRDKTDYFKNLGSY
ncbi:MAG TPA: prephenate dehydratase [Candidatus Altiarchaeales archaeon]|nr:prephenate dehydratase [Candidatus Altiarchaeales archaeon]